MVITNLSGEKIIYSEQKIISQRYFLLFVAIRGVRACLYITVDQGVRSFCIHCRNRIYVNN